MSSLSLQKIKALTLCVASLALIASAMPVFAQETAPEAVPADSGALVEILPAKSLSGEMPYVNEDEATHPPMRLTPDKSELIRLDTEAGTVIIGNPAHLSVMAESAKTLVLIPKEIGATYLLIMDRKGETLMQRHVIVGSPKEKYVRIRKSCANSKDDACQATQVYYCPDMCHEIAGSGGEEDSKDEGGGGTIEEKLKDLSKDIDAAVDEGSEESSGE